MAVGCFWFDKHNPLALFVDKRSEIVTAKDRDKIRTIEIKPDIIADFTHLPFEDNSFYMVVFDPPHLKTLGETSWMAKKYGKLPKDWQSLIHDGFTECMRVLKPNGTLVFKWNESEIKQWMYCLLSLLNLYLDIPLEGRAKQYGCAL